MKFFLIIILTSFLILGLVFFLNTLTYEGSNTNLKKINNNDRK